MNNKYADTFEQRGHPYDLAMQSFPGSRSQEFERLFDVVEMQHVHDVLDLPSGGGYLANHLPPHCRLTSVDPSQPFHTSEEIKYINLEKLVLPEAAYDLVITLAALHHVDNKKGFLSSVAKAIKPGGYCCFADVAAGSGISHFLDDFAGKHNGTGHQGDYLETDSPFPGFTDMAGLTLLEHAVKPCWWSFNSEQDMVEFCRLLFGLKDVANQEIKEALDHYVGYETSLEEIPSAIEKNFTLQNPKKNVEEKGFLRQKGRVFLKWELLYITMRRHV